MFSFTIPVNLKLTWSASSPFDLREFLDNTFRRYFSNLGLFVVTTWAHQRVIFRQKGFFNGHCGGLDSCCFKFWLLHCSSKVFLVLLAQLAVQLPLGLFDLLLIS